jgi:hypothetical protein
MSSVATGHSTLYLDVSLNWQSQAGNYSSLHIRLWSQADGGWSGNSGTPIGSTVTVTGGATGGGSTTFGTTTTVTWIEYDVNVGHDANGYYSGNAHGHLNDTGTSTFGPGADLDQGISLPRIPKVPGPVRNLTRTLTGRSVNITFIAPSDNGGSAISSYTIQYSKNGGGWTGNVSNVSGNYTYTNLPPGSYVFRVYAINGIGSGPATSTTAVLVLSGGKVWDGSAWVDSTPKIWNGMAEVDAILQVWDGDSWAAAL